MDDCAHAEEKQTVCLSPSFIRRPYREGKPKIINCHNSQDTPIWVGMDSNQEGQHDVHGVAQGVKKPHQRRCGTKKDTGYEPGVLPGQGNVPAQARGLNE